MQEHYQDSFRQAFRVIGLRYGTQLDCGKVVYLEDI